MKNSFFSLLLLFSGLLFANGKTVTVNSQEKNEMISESDVLSNTAEIVSDFLLTFEDGIIQPGTGIVHSTFYPVRTVNLGSYSNSIANDIKLNRQSAFQYLIYPLADVKPSIGLHVLLRVFLI
jgi:hypothetical protein